MLSKVYFLICSKTNGRYLVAHPNGDSEPSESGYLLLFNEHFDALSYLNAHGSDVASHWVVESIPSTQLGRLLKRWGFTGVGIVHEPLLPKVEFLSHH
ncbi:MAG: hypothetical protein JOZ78_00300 [Chroococcidiopsidaceae cyanobacterium CP_BM_ER_R8_30]|nr:hypothetical protein [Chroococcidiopsidaceae cyanobacterium CP_BM_ER_R8_30]